MFVCFLLYRLRQLYSNSNVLLVDYKAGPANEALWFKAGVQGVVICELYEPTALVSE